MPKHNEAVAKSYAKALFELARERNQVEAVGRDLATVGQMMREQPGLLDFLSRPWVDARAKGATVRLGGKRQDVLRRVGDGWRIARRTIILDQNVLLAKNLTVFF